MNSWFNIQTLMSLWQCSKPTALKRVEASDKVKVGKTYLYPSSVLHIYPAIPVLRDLVTIDVLMQQYGLSYWQVRRRMQDTEFWKIRGRLYYRKISAAARLKVP